MAPGCSPHVDLAGADGGVVLHPFEDVRVLVTHAQADRKVGGIGGMAAVPAGESDAGEGMEDTWTAR
jgi:8-oxo-dGTP pyrophosphatase MutT (NUDIX family)